MPNQLDKTLIELGFVDLHEVTGMPSIAALIPANRRCGIYVLHCGNGELYAGQAIDVARRYTQHRQVHQDIARLSFKYVALEKLTNEEKRVIWALERAGFHLRNKIHTSITYSPSAFDEIMSPADQENWLSGLDVVDFDGDRPEIPDLRRKYSTRYSKLMTLPLADEVITTVRAYVQTAIPMPRRSEYYYWSCSCLPGQSKHLYVRVNINRQEVFSASVFDNHVYAAFRLAKSHLHVQLAKWNILNPRFLVKYGAVFFGKRYVPGGQDQIAMNILNRESILSALEDAKIRQSIRLFNMRLMRKGINLSFRSHCFDLADELLKG